MRQENYTDPCRLIEFDRNRPVVIAHFHVTYDTWDREPQLHTSAWCWGTSAPGHYSHWTTDPQVRERPRWTASLRYWGFHELPNGKLVPVHPENWPAHRRFAHSW